MHFVDEDPLWVECGPGLGRSGRAKRGLFLGGPAITVFYMHLINKQHPCRYLERVGCEPLQRIEFPTLPNQCNHRANGVRNEVAVQLLHCLRVMTGTAQTRSRQIFACQRSVCLSESLMNTKVIQII